MPAHGFTAVAGVSGGQGSVVADDVSLCEGTTAQRDSFFFFVFLLASGLQILKAERARAPAKGFWSWSCPVQTAVSLM